MSEMIFRVCFSKVSQSVISPEKKINHLVHVKREQANMIHSTGTTESQFWKMGRLYLAFRADRGTLDMM